MNGKVYQIICLTTGEKYIGSTTQTLNQRIGRHLRQLNYWKNKNANFITSFPILERDNYKIEILEECSNFIEREKYHIQNTVCVNKRIPNRSDKEWYEDNVEEILEKKKEYYQKNKEKLKENARQYRLKKKEENKAID